MPEAVAKMCVICGQDVGKKPRTKDSQGRYTCKECLDAAAKAKSAQERARAPVAEAPAALKDDGAIPLAADNSFLLDLAAHKLKPGEQPCPSCGRGMSPDARLCVHCGFNTQTGQRMFVNVLQPKAVEEKKERMVASNLSGLFGWLPVTGLAALVIGGLFLGGMQIEELKIAFYGVYTLYFLAVYVIVVIAGYRSDSTEGNLLAWPGVGIIISVVLAFYGYWSLWALIGIPIGIIYQLYWVNARCDSMHVRGLWWVMAAGMAGCVLFALQDMPPAA